MINRLKLAPTYALIITSLVLAGCSSTTLNAPKEDNPDAFANALEAKRQLAQTPACCDQLEALTYQPLNNDKTQYTSFDGSALAFDFESGKSFYKAYKLDKDTTKLDITISGLFYNTVFVPEVMLLDSQFKKTRIISADKFIYKEAKLFNGDELTANFSIKRPNLNNPANETYFIIYSTDKAMHGETTITHPAKLDARGRSVQEPDIADPIIKHSAMGVVKLDFEMESKGDNYIAPEAQSKTVVSAESMLTEAQYNQKIITAVTENDIDKALQLVDQAEATGSATARSTFIQAIKE